ncbi:hypothetical protein ACFQ1L_22895 [Phytohabitans flavus]|uniref:hypothetical protein n=1 Tax=Phytohabitans flavus TaxID=1076124 RepID=UPI003643338D
MHEWHVETEQHAIPLLASKLSVPPPPEVPLARPRLTRLLDAGARGPVTLVAAPAGWGKTVLMGAWARALPDQPVAWYTVEAGDGPRFWAYVGAALAKRGVAVSEDADLERLASAVARLERPVALLLDDLHLAVDQTVADGLDFLVRHSDRRLHLVAAARTEPPLGLHRWRLEGGLTELAAHDLAFTRDETAELLAGHRVPASARRVGDLHLRTEGWPAGLRFAARSLYAHPDPDRFIAGYGGEHPSVAGYLVDEVLSGQPAEAKDVLLRTSIAEPVSGELADALTGREDAARVLAELERTNGFVVPLKSRPGAYRYHRMFGELLRAELRRRSPDQVTDLHRRAAAWHADRHMPPDALRHALAGRDWTRATELLVLHWPELIPYGPESDQLPAPPIPPPPASALRADPALALAYAAAFLDAQDRTSATAFLRLAQRHRDRMPQGQRARYALVAAALRLAEAQLYGDQAAVLPAARQLLDLSATAGIGAAAARPVAASAGGTGAGVRNGGPGTVPASPLGRNTGPAATAAAGVRNATPVTPGAGPAGTASLARNIGPTIQPNGQNGGPHGTPGTSTLPRNIGPGANTPGSPGTGNGHGELSPFGRAGDGAAGAASARSGRPTRPRGRWPSRRSAWPRWRPVTWWRPGTRSPPAWPRHAPPGSPGPRRPALGGSRWSTPCGANCGRPARPRARTREDLRRIARTRTWRSPWWRCTATSSRKPPRTWTVRRRPGGRWRTRAGPCRRRVPGACRGGPRRPAGGARRPGRGAPGDLRRPRRTGAAADGRTLAGDRRGRPAHGPRRRGGRARAARSGRAGGRRGGCGPRGRAARDRRGRGRGSPRPGAPVRRRPDGRPARAAAVGRHRGQRAARGPRGRRPARGDRRPPRR